MSGGPKFPDSVYYGTSGKIFPNLHSTTTNASVFEGHGCMASLDADTDLQLEFEMPPDLPSGTAKLVCRAMANATSNDAKFNVRWKSFATEEDLDIAKGSYPTAEGTQTITWASGDDDVYKEVKVTLDADTVTAAETIHMYVTFETTDWDLAAVSTWKFFIVWEDA